MQAGRLAADSTCHIFTTCHMRDVSTFYSLSYICLVDSPERYDQSDLLPACKATKTEFPEMATVQL